MGPLAARLCSAVVAVASTATPSPQFSPQRLDHLPLAFLANQGLVDDPGIAFLVRGREQSLFFGADGVTLALRDRRDGERGRWIVRMEFEGGAKRVMPVGEDPLPTVFSSFVGRKERWRGRIPGYRRIVYHDLWPGIDLLYSGTAESLEYSFRVRPGADPRRIRLRYRGLSELRLRGDEALDAVTPAASFVDAAPKAWEVIEGRKAAIPVRYRLEGSMTAEDGFPFAFELGTYDPTRELIIDPAVLIYCGYLGGRGYPSG